MTPEEAPPAWVEESTRIEAVGSSIPAAITLPRPGPPVSLVVIVPGSLFSDVDGDFPCSTRTRTLPATWHTSSALLATR